ncbi:hypothetical protein CDD80_7022 [Ophiocordyceps camponoti-rufipedis]|uniref:Ribosomal protein L5 C-terminal domain-containing protein n=1 Tax=Ophiocordyceps camponoti-rufipedis TaxID=2004952 RepID=A0A2C5YJZ7_9HYPO|nr:hypothetical protein CDD80_7022 [Ophiocordyceps camponoti-rufipedis]
MAAARDGYRLARAIGRHVRPPSPAITLVSLRQASTASNAAADLSDLESTPSFTAPPPDRNLAEKFDEANRMRWDAVGKREMRGLPGSRYQYHPPKFYRGPLHPIQVPKSSDPIARDFVPGPFNYPRIKHTYETTAAADMIMLTYNHIAPGTVKPESKKGVLRSWDDSSPYHVNRGLRSPRGTSSNKLRLVERNIAWHNVPELRAVTINAYSPKCGSDKEYLHVARAVLQAITGKRPEVSTIKKTVASWGIRKGSDAGAVVTLRGAQAYEFVDKLATLVLPKVKDWPGIWDSSGDSSGNVALGLKSAWMGYFPEMEYNYDMYPVHMVPGCHIIIHTSATSDKQGRLLLGALGFPFAEKVDTKPAKRSKFSKFLTTRR